jgi:hypothetical protein
MAADTSVDIIVNQKASLEVTFSVKAANGSVLDLTNYTASAKYKQDFQTSDSQALPFNTVIADAANGEIVISLTPTQTANLKNARYVYDVTITDVNDFKTRIVEGFLKISSGVT